MIGDLLSTMADAQKLSIAQIQKSVQDGTLPAYVGIPLLQDKVKQRNEAAQLLAGQKQQHAPKIAEQVMAAADQITMPGHYGPAAPMAAGAEQGPTEGIEGLQSNLPEEYAAGGIIAFSGEDDSYVPAPDEQADLRALERYSGVTLQDLRDREAARMLELGGGRGRGAIAPANKVTMPTAGQIPAAAPSPPQIAAPVQAPTGGGRGIGTGISLGDILKGAVPTVESGGARGRGAVPVQPSSQESAGIFPSIKDWYSHHVAPAIEMAAAPGDTEHPAAQGPGPAAETKQKHDYTTTRGVAMPGAKHAAATKRAVEELTQARPEPQASAPAQEDTSIADEIARSRGERDNMMKMILGDQAKDRQEAEQDKWLALAKAGFQVAGGRSPYAMVNIGEGMAGGIGDIMAAKHHAAQAEEAKIAKAADYESKSQQLENTLREMGIMQQHYKSMEPYYAAQTQEAVNRGRLYGAQADLYPTIQQAKMAKMAAGAGGAGKEPKASMDLNEWKFFKQELPAKYLKDPSTWVGLPNPKDLNKDSPDYARVMAEAQKRAAAKAAQEEARFMAGNAKRPVSYFTGQ